MAVNSDLKVSTLLPESPNHENEIPNNLKDISASISSSDLEKATPNTTETLSIEPNLVTWTSPTDPRNPKNWPKTSKWLVTGIVSLFLFVTIMCSTVISPALPAIGADLHIENDAELQTAMSIYVLGYAFGPLFLAPLSELYGRVRVLQLSNVYFVIWSVVCGFARTKEQMIVARFMAGIGSSAPLGIGGGILSDVWHAAERGQSTALYSFLPLLAPAFGPLIGGFISQNLNWSWSFWIMAIVTTPPIILSFFVFRETYAPVILHRLAAKLRKETGNHDLYTIYDKERPSLPTRLRIALTRPTLMLFQQPIIQVWALFGAYSFGLLYIVLTTFPTLWIDQYGQSPSEAGLQCLWLGLGFTTGICIGGIFQDRIYVYLRKRYLQTSEEITHPPVAEHRLPLMIPSVLFMSIGLIIYGWTARAHTHWVGPGIGSVIYTTGYEIFAQCSVAYIIDAFPVHTASALAAVSVSKSVAGFAFPLFAPALYNALGWGYGNTVLAAVAFGLGMPVICGLWANGNKIPLFKFANLWVEGREWSGHRYFGYIYSMAMRLVEIISLS